eukprot:Seg1794.2 transcript_id=Seg1794.2/GoldUCD/mRNA.D3Y31 product="General transcription factor II-I repeat domain-containing protein 1" protein_id=Seg1794.2/GoldUCD/D3Y31
MESERPAPYSKISQTQRQMLEKFYKGREGHVPMQSTRGGNMKSMIQEAARETGLSKEKIEKWIGNENLKRRKNATGNAAQESSSPKPNSTPQTHGNRKNCGYNVFCRDFFLSDAAQTLDQESKLRLAGEKWRSLTQQSREWWNLQAKKPKNESAMSEAEKKKLIVKHKRRLCEEIDMLEYLGCESATLLLCGMEVMQLGSTKGTEYLDENFHVTNSFRSFFDASDEGEKRFSYKDVKNLFNQKYSETIDRPGAKVPYLRKGFRVEGLPDGVPFRKPCDYGANQIKLIMKARDSIKFIVLNEIPTDEIQMEVAATEEEIEPVAAEIPFKAVTGVLRLVSEERAKDAHFNGNLIREEELEVVNFKMRCGELEELLEGSSYLFHEDALANLKANIAALAEKKGILLPVYTTSKSNFWLFFFDGKLEDIENLFRAGESVPGLWLHKIGKKDSKRYKLKEASTLVSINKENVIKDKRNRSIISYEITGFTLGSTVTVDDDFSESVFTSLAADGFLV